MVPVLSQAESIAMHSFKDSSACQVGMVAAHVYPGLPSTGVKETESNKDAATWPNFYQLPQHLIMNWEKGKRFWKASVQNMKHWKL